jgi:hypothetical protein
MFFSWEGKQKIFFLSCGTEIHFSIKTIHWLLIFSSAIFLFLAGDSKNLFFSYKLVPVVEVCLYWPTPFFISLNCVLYQIQWQLFYLCVCWNLTAKRGYNDYILYQDAICNWSSSKFFNCYRLHVWNHSKLRITREIISKLRMAGHTNFEDDQLQIASW